ncbi:Dehydrogenase/reductase SDR family member 4 [Araneus ventricosus]|uniref:Dehydrogenase/reductase SDR family member 4 n=1 Tax=Araneus ventricosus TaxID=182803 RepID=A0A4Y2H242_ARAVE|nr:Dehydrogenase/reductase SDR family member 4 [Araneus ventricosus]
MKLRPKVSNWMLHGTRLLTIAVYPRIRNRGRAGLVSTQVRNTSQLHGKRPGKVDVVTTSTEGIGFAIAKRLANDGASVVENKKLLLDFSVANYGGNYILISNAAANPTICRVLDTNEKAWDKIFDTNVKAAFILTQPAVPLIEKRGGGSIVYISSVAAYKVVVRVGAYSVSKTALLVLTNAAAEHCSSMNIRVNCGCPAIINTKFSSVILSSDE